MSIGPRTVTVPITPSPNPDTGRIARVAGVGAAGFGDAVALLTAGGAACLGFALGRAGCLLLCSGCPAGGTCRGASATDAERGLGADTIDAERLVTDAIREADAVLELELRA